MTRKVVIVDYGMGNVFSVCNAFERVGASAILTSDPSAISSASRLVLPGVGAFSTAMHNLKGRGLDQAIAAFISTERPFLGICVGMQVLMETSRELGEHAGLGYINGEVVSISDGFQGAAVKIPHIGWGKVEIPPTLLQSKISTRRDRPSFFYFVHSYMCKPKNIKHILAEVEYENKYLPAIVGRDNLLGVQFHPERSGPDGLHFLDEFAST